MGSVVATTLRAPIMARSNSTRVSSTKKKVKPKSASRTTKRSRALRTAATSDHHELYELSVQCTEAECDFIERAWKQTGRAALPSSLREDFCGTAIASCAWVRRRKSNIAVGVDLDRSVLKWGEQRHWSTLTTAERARLSIHCEDVLTAKTTPVDVVVAMNFSYFLFKERAKLLAYFKRAFTNVRDGGIFICDAYGGSEAHSEQEEERHLDGFTYVWEQHHYNPVNSTVVNYIHFRFADGTELRRAFAYHWRLWTLVELQEILKEAGFGKTVVWWEGTDKKTGSGNGVFRPTTKGEACTGWVAYLVSEKIAVPSRKPAPKLKARTLSA